MCCVNHLIIVFSLDSNVVCLAVQLFLTMFPAGSGAGGGMGVGGGTTSGGVGGVSGSRVGSVGGLHKSMTRLSSSQQINLVPTSHLAPSPGPGLLTQNSVGTNNRSVTAINSIQRSSQYGISSGGVTVTTTQDSIASARSSM